LNNEASIRDYLGTLKTTEINPANIKSIEKKSFPASSSNFFLLQLLGAFYLSLVCILVVAVKISQLDEDQAASVK
jgi:hypothetical protein